jgi:hypothetical protein
MDSIWTVGFMLSIHCTPYTPLLSTPYYYTGIYSKGGRVSSPGIGVYRGRDAGIGRYRYGVLVGMDLITVQPFHYN